MMCLGSLSIWIARGSDYVREATGFATASSIFSQLINSTNCAKGEYFDWCHQNVTLLTPLDYLNTIRFSAQTGRWRAYCIFDIS